MEKRANRRGIKQWFLRNFRYLPTTLHGVTSQNTAGFITAVVRIAHHSPILNATLSHFESNQQFCSKYSGLRHISPSLPFTRSRHALSLSPYTFLLNPSSFLFSFLSSHPPFTLPFCGNPNILSRVEITSFPTLTGMLLLKSSRRSRYTKQNYANRKQYILKQNRFCQITFFLLFPRLTVTFIA